MQLHVNKRPVVPLPLLITTTTVCPCRQAVQTVVVLLLLTSILGSYEAVPQFSPSAYLQSPPSARTRLFLHDPVLPKDLRLFHKSDGFDG